MQISVPLTTELQEQKLKCLIAKAKKKDFHFSYICEVDMMHQSVLYESKNLKLQKCDHFHYIMTIKQLTSPFLGNTIFVT